MTVGIMKSVLCVLAACCLLAQAVQRQTHTADKTFLTKQKNIYELFWHVDQPTVYHPELYQKARTFSIVENIENYSDQEAVNEFLDLLKHGMLPRGQVFTLMNPQVYHQTVVLFRVLHSAKTFDVFYNTAVWARFHVNEYMYTYCLSVAVLHRPDTQYIKLPPLYEVLPHYFFNEDVMQKAYNIAMGDVVGVKKSVTGGEYYMVPANYTGWYMTRHNTPEQKMSYFTEDVGLNYFYFLISHHDPPFMNSTPSTVLSQVRGEHYFYIHKQLLNRYYLERLSNDLGEISVVTVDRPVTPGFYPTMSHRNGLPFPHREHGAIIPLTMHQHVLRIKDLHTRISTAIDLGFLVDSMGKHVNIYTQNGLNLLGNVVQGNADSMHKQFYGYIDALARKVFGFGLETNVKYHMVPSALEIFCTSMRDPVFYSIYKNILTYYHRYKQNLPKYTQEELSFPGVKVESVNVDKLTTYFDYFESMLSNGVSVRSHKEARNTMIKARQYRLNHKPFTYHITVNSDKVTKGMIRVFLGPKFDVFGHEVDLEHNYMNFLQLDEWIVDLKTGSNTIERSSHESVFVVPDDVPSDVFYKRLETSIDTSETFTYSNQPYGFPDRLILPKGKKGGMTFKLFVVVSPLDESKVITVDSPIWGQMITDERAMGFPLDRPVDPFHFVLPNMQLKDVVVYHKEMEELNVVI